MPVGGNVRPAAYLSNDEAKLPGLGIGTGDRADRRSQVPGKRALRRQRRARDEAASRYSPLDHSQDVEVARATAPDAGGGEGVERT